MTSTEIMMVRQVRRILETVLQNIDQQPATLSVEQWSWTVDTACHYLHAAKDALQAMEEEV